MADHDSADHDSAADAAAIDDATPAHDADRIEELLALERRGWDSLCDSTGDRFYGELMTDDGVMVLAGGFTLDRDGVRRSLADAPPWRRFELENAALIPLGSEAAALRYLGRAWREGGEPPFEAWMTSTYRRIDGAWRLALYTQTPVATEG
ncbi:MAG: nuclear transport factor 2 family protein [Actinomycetales bacterium]|nr:nuclear transport factor 2 family protein [Actinomycetales bacterium]